MSEGKVPTQSDAQAGSSGQAASVGSAVGVLRSSDEAPVMGVEPRRDAGLDGGSGRGRRLRKEISLYDEKKKITNPVSRHAGKRRDGTRLGKPDTGNPFVRFDEG